MGTGRGECISPPFPIAENPDQVQRFWKSSVLSYTYLVHPCFRAPPHHLWNAKIITPLKHHEACHFNVKWDLAHAEHVVGARLCDWACFSSQQAAEKAYKAVLQSYGADVWGHSIADLLEAIEEHVAISEELTDIALELDKAYITTRCPDVHPSGSPSTRYTKREAERMVSFAKQIVTFCQSLLSRAQ